MARKVPLLALLLVFGLPVLCFAQPVPLQSRNRGPQSERVRLGVGHFERAFYQLVPQKRDAEATREFDLAVEQFEGELAAHPASIDAHAYLAKIFAVRKEFGKAAAHYDRLIELEPLNVDLYVLAALAYIDNMQVTEARARLVAAKDRTSDPAVVAKLTEYLSKLDQRKR